MKLYIIAILGLLLIFSALSQAEVLFWDDFEDGVLSDKWKVVTEVFTEEDGVVTMSQGAGQYPSLAVDQLIDFSDGVTFQAVLNKGSTNDIVMPVSPTDGSELARKIPWDGPFVRICLDPNTGHPIVQSTPKGNGVEVEVLVDLEPFDWDNDTVEWAMYLKGDSITLYQDGEEVFSGEHTGDFTEGYLTFGGSKAVDTTIDDVVIYTGDYDKNIMDKARAVSSAGKLPSSWGAIKDRYQ